MELSPEATRVLGCLVEKQYTTPDIYPMSVNAILTACNQSTNRDPVVSYSEQMVLAALDELRIEHRLARLIHAGAGSRVDKYRHGLDERLGLTPPETAVLAILALRGPQTAAEIKSRTERMIDMTAEHVERVVGRLCDPTLAADSSEMSARSSDGMMRASSALTAETPDGFARAWDGPLVVRLERMPGQKEARLMHLLQPFDPSSVQYVSGSATSSADQRSTSNERLQTLEARVTALEAQLTSMTEAFETFRQQF
jgi:uncharacterized protein